MTTGGLGVAARSRHAAMACLGLAVAALLLIVTARQANATTRSTAPARDVGPGPVNTVLRTGQLTVGLAIRPNRAAASDTVVLTVSRKGLPVRRAAVILSFTMLSMSMGTASFHLSEQHAGQYVYVGPATVMPGDWELSFQIRPEAGVPQTTSVDDRVAD
jgi:hypothetical protein